MKRRLFILESLLVLPVVVLRTGKLQSIDPDPENLRIAYCGKDCSACKVYRATKTNDISLKRQLASEWSEILRIPLSPSNISCYGCKVRTGTHFCYCNTCRTSACKKETLEEEFCYFVCRIRKCAESKKLSNCDACAHFPCEHHNSIKKRLFNS